MLDSFVRKKIFFFRKDVISITSFSFYLNILFQFLVVFISWNFIGIFIVFYLYSLFAILKKYRNAKFKTYFFYTFLYILIYHIGALFWMFKIKYGVIGFCFNVAYYTIPFCIYFLFNKYIKPSLVAFIFIFGLFEIFLDTSNFSFPWLIIGNCLSSSNFTPQIYEFIGSIGGSLLLLITAYAIFIINKKIYKAIIFFTLLMFLYFFGYYAINFNTKKEDEKEYINCLFFNPDKYMMLDRYYSNEEIAFFIKKNTKNRHFDKIFIPELTFKSISFKSLKNSIVLDYIKETCQKENSIFYSGASGVLKKGYLSNVYFRTNGIEIHEKSKEKLVPYTEYTPKLLRNLLDKNISFDYIDYNEWLIEKKKNRELPLICYEVIYSNYVNLNILDTDLMILLTSEKFLNNSGFGEKQYNNIIKLRAIETRRPIIKSSNAGLSYYMNEFGIIEKSSNKMFSSILINKTKINNVNTFYTDFIAKKNIYLYFNILLIIIIIIKKNEQTNHNSHSFITN